MNVPQIGSNFEISGYNSVKCTGDPNQDAKNFAEANNISVSEARTILSAKFGEPAAKQANDVVKAATTATDDDSELVTGSQIEVDGYNSVAMTGDPQQDAKNFADANNISVDEAKEILSAEFGAPKTTQTATAADEVEEDDENAIDTIKAEVDDYVTDIQDKWQEVSNTYNAWQKAGGGWSNNGTPLWKYHAAVKDLQLSIADFITYVGTIDLSGVTAAQKSAIESAKEDAKTWSDRFGTAVNSKWWENSEKWTKGATAQKKARTLTQDLITQLKNAGLSTSELTKPTKPTA
ncbi:MAG: hypothetical protein K6A44_01520 [bacterium]|nr:hypothetical protein [bacterium]